MRLITVRIMGLIIGLSAFLLAFSPAQALPVLFPDNGHYYEAVAANLDWDIARVNAQSSVYMGMSGHLATMTSAEENAWVWSNLGNPVRYYLGGTDYPVDGSWNWITAGEPWSYTNWFPGEPNNWWASEDALSFWDGGMWNDLPMLADYWHDGNQYVYGYIVEYEQAYLIPEPSVGILIGVGLLGIFFLRRKGAVVS